LKAAQKLTAGCGRACSGSSPRLKPYKTQPQRATGGSSFLIDVLWAEMR